MLAEQPLGVPLTDIGEFTAEPGLWQRDGGRPAAAVDAVGLGAYVLVRQAFASLTLHGSRSGWKA